MTPSNDPSSDPAAAAETAPSPYAVDRRRFVGYVLGGATLVAAADLVLVDAPPAGAEIPTLPQVAGALRPQRPADRRGAADRAS